jgi:hypothetical protein
MAKAMAEATAELMEEATAVAKTAAATIKGRWQ